MMAEHERARHMFIPSDRHVLRIDKFPRAYMTRLLLRLHLQLCPTVNRKIYTHRNTWKQVTALPPFRGLNKCPIPDLKV